MESRCKNNAIFWKLASFLFLDIHNASDFASVIWLQTFHPFFLTRRQTPVPQHYLWAHRKWSLYLRGWHVSLENPELWPWWRREWVDNFKTCDWLIDIYPESKPWSVFLGLYLFNHTSHLVIRVYRGLCKGTKICL